MKSKKRKEYPILKAYCDGCGAELETLQEAIDIYPDADSIYCELCQKKADEIQSWYDDRRKQLGLQLQSERDEMLSSMKT